MLNDTKLITFKKFKTNLFAQEEQFLSWLIRKLTLKWIEPEEILGTKIQLKKADHEQVILVQPWNAASEHEILGLIEQTNPFPLDQTWAFTLNSICFETKTEYSIKDQQTAAAWNNWLEVNLAALLQKKHEIANLLAISEIQNLALALGQFHIIPDVLQLLNAAADYQSAQQPWLKDFGSLVVNLFRQKMQAAPLGLQRASAWKWIESPLFAKSLVLQQNNQPRQHMSSLLHQLQISPWLGKNCQDYLGTKYLNSLDFSHLISLFVMHESLIYSAELLEASDQAQEHSLKKMSLALWWKTQIGLHPQLAVHNHIFVQAIPKQIRLGATKTAPEGLVYDLSNYNQFLAFQQAVLTQQAELYEPLQPMIAKLRQEIKNQADWQAFLTKQTIVLQNN